MPSIWRADVFEGENSLIGETDALRIEIVPPYGGKTVSLYDKRFDKEWLDVRSGLTPRRPLHTEEDWSQFDCMGWDELFPTVDPCPYPTEPWRGTPLGEHGELWRLAWEADIFPDGRSLKLTTRGRTLPYRFEKTVTLADPAEVRLRYAVSNLSDHPLLCIWLLHPLLRVAVGSMIEFEPAVREIEVSNTLHGRLGGRGSVHTWPCAKGGIDLQIVSAPEDETADKWFVRSGQPVARVRVRDAQTEASLEFNLDSQSVPYLGVWSNCGGWNGDHNLAVEPSTGYLDRLDEAAICGRCMRIPAREMAVWEIDLSLR